MKNILTGFQILFSVFLIALILLQSRGSGLGSTWGGSSETFRSKRGVEKLLFTLTIVSAIIFCLTSYLNLLIQ